MKVVEIVEHTYVLVRIVKSATLVISIAISLLSARAGAQTAPETHPAPDAQPASDVQPTSDAQRYADACNAGDGLACVYMATQFDTEHAAQWLPKIQPALEKHCKAGNGAHCYYLGI